MGLRLAGPRLAHVPGGADIVSDGVTPGSIQVPADGQPIVRIIPNVNPMIRQSMSALCPGEFVSDEQLATVSNIFEAVGLVEIMAEKDMAIYAAIAGCSPAYTFEYIDAMARAAVKNGLPKAQAVRIAAQCKGLPGAASCAVLPRSVSDRRGRRR